MSERNSTETSTLVDAQQRAVAGRTSERALTLALLLRGAPSLRVINDARVCARDDEVCAHAYIRAFGFFGCGLACSEGQPAENTSRRQRRCGVIWAHALPGNLHARAAAVICDYYLRICDDDDDGARLSASGGDSNKVTNRIRTQSWRRQPPPFCPLCARESGECLRRRRRRRLSLSFLFTSSSIRRRCLLRRRDRAVVVDCAFRSNLYTNTCMLLAYVLRQPQPLTFQ